jgi:O-antigen ligase
MESCRVSLRIKRTQIIDWLIVCFIAFLPLSWAAFAFGSFYRLFTIVAFVAFFAVCKGNLTICAENVRLFTAWILLVLYVGVSLLWAENTNSAMSEALGMALLCATVFIFASRYAQYTEKQLDYAWIASGIICLLLFFFGEREVASGRETLIILGTPTDHNEFAGVFIVPVSLGMYKLMGAKRIGIKVVYIALMVLELYAILLTGSRGALLSTVIAVAITALLSRKLSVNYIFSVLVFLLVVILLVSTIVLPLIPEEVLNRFTMEEIEETGGAGRAEIWERAWKKIREGSLLRLLFGYGNGAKLVLNKSGRVSAMHNQLLQVLANYGLVGLGLYLSLLWESFRNILRRNRRYAGSFLGMMALSLTLSMSPSYKPLWILLMMGFAFVGNEKTQQIDKV